MTDEVKEEVCQNVREEIGYKDAPIFFTIGNFVLD